jgi:hypothetical protein
MHGGCAMNRRLLLLVSVAVVLALVLLFDRGVAPPVETSEAPAPPVERPQASAEEGTVNQAMLNPLQALDAGNFTAMLERPLFNPGRAERAPEPPPEPPPPPMEELPPEMPPESPGPLAQDFTLIAVAAGPSGHVAAVRLAATGEVLYLREGQPVQSWSVMAVNDRSVVIGTAESSVELSLFDSETTQAQDTMEQAPPPDTYDEPPLDIGMEQNPMDEFYPQQEMQQ